MNTEKKVATVTSQRLSSEEKEIIEDSNLVAILVKYPEGYIGRKMMLDGKSYLVSPEVAKIVISQGIASPTGDDHSILLKPVDIKLEKEIIDKPPEEDDPQPDISKTRKQKPK
jgi:hypothetical protein